MSTSVSGRVRIVFPAFPPQINGIGDHTRLLAIAIAQHGKQVEVVTSSAYSPQRVCSDTTGVTVTSIGSMRGLRGAARVVRALSEGRDTLNVLQFEQFAYGPRGFNPWMPLLIAATRVFRGRNRLALIAHEDYVYPSSVKTFVMWTYQRFQFRVLIWSSNFLFVSTPAWLHSIPKNRTALVIPMFSNLPDPYPVNADAVLPTGVTSALSLAIDSCVKRAADSGKNYGAEDIRVVCWFGNLAAERHDDFRAVVNAVNRAERAVLVYVGSDGSEAVKLAARKLTTSFVNLGVLSSEVASSTLQMAHIGVAPFSDGVSMRRGSFLAMLQAGCRVVTTWSSDTMTDSALRQGIDLNVFAAVPARDPAGLQDRVEMEIRATTDSFDMAAREFYKLHCSPEKAAMEILQAAYGSVKVG